ncbi:phosphotransferase family protein [Streptomyces sp. TP-A0874]|uniref:phosphotransferase family protein n=1 Tax=Streptomyces sp. TP-A0874 TaxID=549819 RepID=UPI0008529F87|nr:aminoglycoside phosphotransferase family protein [Streptomyces sp. TP-A0874]
MAESLTEQLTAVARRAAAAETTALLRQPCEPASREERDPGPLVLADRADGTVVRLGPVVAKAHAADSDLPELLARLRIAAHPRLRDILLPPLAVPGAGDRPPAPTRDGRPISLWPYGAPVQPDEPDAAPWEAAGELLARLHAVPTEVLPGPVPAMRGPVKAARAVARLAAAGRSPAADTVLAAWSLVPPWARGEVPPSHPGSGLLCHGDFHLGQLVGGPDGTGEWLLIDVDDLGVGDPAWDLARPAAWYATGLLAPEAWGRFLGSYQRAGGPVWPPGADPWARLDIPARSLTVQTAAVSLAKAAAAGRAPDEVETALVDACERIRRMPPREPS